MSSAAFGRRCRCASSLRTSHASRPALLRCGFVALLCETVLLLLGARLRDELGHCFADGRCAASAWGAPGSDLGPHPDHR
eukprot:130707-Rhodomonas_salina.3